MDSPYEKIQKFTKITEIQSLTPSEKTKNNKKKLYKTKRTT